MRGQRTILDPGNLANVPVETLLHIASAGWIGIDHRFLHAILDRPDQGIPGLVQFAAESHPDDPIDLDPVLLDIFRYLRTPASLPFLISMVRRNPIDVDDDLVEAIALLGAAAVDSLLQLLEELEAREEGSSDVLFLLSQLRVRDARILDALTRRLNKGDPDAALFLEMYGDRAAIPALEAAIERLPKADAERIRLQSFVRNLSAQPEHLEEQDEPFDLWSVYPEQDSPPLDVLNDEDRLLMLAEGNVELRSAVASFYRGATLPDTVSARLLEAAKQDPDAEVRGESWEALEDKSNEPEIRRAMLAILADANASIEEKSGVAVALAQQTDNATVFQAIEDLYANPAGRAKALKAMGRSFDKRFASYPARHLDDTDPDVKRQAIWAVGYLALSSEAPRLVPFFDDDEFRTDALFAYALSVPAETSRGRIRSLLNKIRNVAGGFQLDERELIETALDQRLILHGMKPVFSAGDDDETEDESKVTPVVKPGRNDPCPCGSGKKYKKCCGA